MARDPYTVLEVPRGADEATIRDAYRRLAKQYHPDLHPDDPRAAQKMNELNEAYEAIRHPSPGARTARANPYAQPNPGYAGRRDSRSGYSRPDAQDADDLWEEIFRQAQERQRGARPRASFRLGRLILVLLLGYMLLNFFTRGFLLLLGGGSGYAGHDYGIPFESYQTAPFFGESQED